MIDIYLNDDVIIRTITKDVYGAISSTSDAAIKGYIEYKVKNVTNFEGVEAVSNAQIYIKTRTINFDDKVVFDSIEHSILIFQKPRDFTNKFMILFVN